MHNSCYWFNRHLLLLPLLLLLQTSTALDSELSLISSLLQQQHSALADLASDASAAADAHRESLTVSQRKVQLLQEMLITLQEKLAEADHNTQALLQGKLDVYLPY